MNDSVLVTGGNGLVGSKFVSDFQKSYQFEPIDISHPTNPVDITNLDNLIEVFEESDASHVVHFAAFTNVTAAWQQQGDKSGAAYQVNVVGTQNIIKACQETDKRLVHISTAYVFNGDKDTKYVESDPTTPIEWYGQTKAMAEEAIQSSSIKWSILRIDQPFRSDIFPKADTAHRIIQGLIDDNLYPQFNNHFFGPTVIEDFAKVIDWVIRTKAEGVYHASSGEKWSDFEFASAIKEALNLPGKVEEGDLNEYLKTLDRPYQRNTSMDTNKLFSEIDFKPRSVMEALQELKY